MSRDLFRKKIKIFKQVTLTNASSIHTYYYAHPNQQRHRKKLWFYNKLKKRRENNNNKKMHGKKEAQKVTGFLIAQKIISPHV